MRSSSRHRLCRRARRGSAMSPLCPVQCQYRKAGAYELSHSAGGMSMSSLHVRLATASAAVGLLLSNSIAAQSNAHTPQELPPAAQAAGVRIAGGPELESAGETSAIIRWRSNNPGGTDDHYGIVHYGTNPKELNQTAKSHIRLNRTHSYTVFRVRLDGLAPRTTYYYTVDSIGAN